MTPLDTVRAVETPEGIVLHLYVAGPVARTLAWFIDALLRYTLFAICAALLSTLGELGLGLTLILLFLLEWFYPVVFELRSGATPGKRALGLKVVSDSGAPVDLTASLVRNLLRTADFLPLCYGFGLVCMLLNRDFKRLGDLAAGTVVIYQTPPAAKSSLPTGPARAPALPLDAEGQRLLVNFAERSAALSPARRAELAELLPTLTASHGEQAVQTLLAQARWLSGATS